MLGHALRLALKKLTWLENYMLFSHFIPDQPLQAQASTEYLIVIAIVLVLALTIFSAFGSFPSFSYNAQISDSVRWWASAAAPIQIVDFKQTGSSLSLIITNSAPLPLEINSFNLSGETGTYAPASGLPIFIPAGGRAQANFTAENCTGHKIVSYEISIAYKIGEIGGLAEKGAKPLYVQCSD